MATTMAPLTFEEYRGIVADLLPAVEPQDIVRETSFFDDLYVDSVKLLEILLRIEELGARIPVEAAWQLRTAGDLYELYVNHRSPGDA
jgi:acyl carrier protein